MVTPHNGCQPGQLIELVSSDYRAVVFKRRHYGRIIKLRSLSCRITKENIYYRILYTLITFATIYLSFHSRGLMCIQLTRSMRSYYKNKIQCQFSPVHMIEINMTAQYSRQSSVFLFFTFYPTKR